jgi:hypothetical protein
MLCAAATLLFLAAGCGDQGPVEEQAGSPGGKADDAWHHVVLESTDHTRINIDFVRNFLPDTTSYKPTDVFTADPAYVNVRSDNLTGTGQVRVVLNNYERCELEVIPYSYALDLTWQGDHFSGNLNDATMNRSYLKFPSAETLKIRMQGYGGIFSYCQDIAVVIDGNWLTDPISQIHNFSFNLFDTP